MWGGIKMTNSSGGSTGVLNFLAYIAVVMVGLMLAIAYFLKGNGGVLGDIANALAYIVTACYSWRYARNKGIVWVVVWGVAVALIAVFMIVPMIVSK
jgi:hypothetical protein